MTDSKALKILIKSRRGNLTDAERRYCIEKGVLTVHEPVSHEKLIKQIKMAASAVSLDKAVNGFLYSISTKDFQYRTALSSLIWANSLPEHKLVPSRVYSGTYSCQICGGGFRLPGNHSCLDMEEYCANRLKPCKEFMDICYESDIYYPLHLWRGKYGINYSVMDRIMGAQIAEKILNWTTDCAIITV